MRLLIDSTTTLGFATSARRSVTTMPAYSASVTDPSQGAIHRPISAIAQALRLGRFGNRPLHWRIGKLSWTAATVEPSAVEP